MSNHSSRKKVICSRGYSEIIRYSVYFLQQRRSARHDTYIIKNALKHLSFDVEEYWDLCKRDFNRKLEEGKSKLCDGLLCMDCWIIRFLASVIDLCICYLDSSYSYTPFVLHCYTPFHHFSSGVSDYT